MTAELLWTPSRERVEGSRMHRLMRECAAKDGIAPDWSSLHRWSIQHRSEFWRGVFDMAEIKAHRPARATTEGEGMLGTRWFPGMELNFAEHLLRFDDDRPAIHAWHESGRRRTLSYRELRRDVGACAAAMRSVGVQAGDRVCGFLPNVPEAVTAMLAATSLGAAWSSCSPDFGIAGVLDRFGQINPKLLIAADGYTYAGKQIDLRDRVAEIRRQLPGLQQVVMVGCLESQKVAPSDSGMQSWEAFVGKGRGGVLSFEPLPFDHPVYIMYSSGTTGVPKCIVHGAGGTLLQHMKELMLHCDLSRDDVLLYFTTCGWMMWNWLVSGLGVGASIVLYDGSPLFPDGGGLWAMAAELGVTVFGTSPKYLSACASGGVFPGKDCNLSRLRSVLSTGSPLTPDGFRWVYQRVKGDVQLASICGGTDLLGCFMLGNPLLAVYAGEIQGLGLGMDVHAFNESGDSVRDMQGELVCCSAFPSQPTGFWNDADGGKYRKAYFDHYPGVWRHGDCIEITARGGVVVTGRSDATLNPGGVRIGTAEIYRVLEGMEEIVDSVAVGKRTPDADVAVCLFVVLRLGLTLDDELRRKIQQRIAEGATRRHVPAIVLQVSAVPYTLSGKKVELAVSHMIHGEAVLNQDALANPESLEQYRTILGTTSSGEERGNRRGGP